MKHFATLSAVCAISLSALAAPAQADIYIFTHSGTVASGTDIYGLFGRKNADLTGKDYTLSLMFDADSLTLDDYSGPSYSSNIYYAGSSLVKFTINGKDLYVEPFDFSYGLVVVNPPLTSSTIYGVSVKARTLGEFLAFELASETQFMGASDFSPPIQYAPTDAELANPLAPNRYWNGYDYKFVFNTKQISLTSQAGGLPPIPAGVPEPASWALMILGFGLAGAAARRRRTLAAA